MSVIVHLPEELAARLSAEATRRGQDLDKVAAAVLAEGLRRDTDPLEAFIGSGHSGRTDLGRRHREILTEALAGTTARDA